MSLAELILDEPKPFLNVRVNDLTIDGSTTSKGDHNITGNLKVTGTISTTALENITGNALTVNATSEDLTLKTTTSGDVLLDPAGVVDVGLSGMKFQNGTLFYTPSPLHYYEVNITEQLSFTGAFSDTFACAFVRMGAVCTLHWLNIFGAATANEILTSGAIAERYWPIADVNEVKWGSDDSANVYVTFVLSTAGVITIGVGETQQPFTNSGTCSCWSGSITYVVSDIS